MLSIVVIAYHFIVIETRSLSPFWCAKYYAQMLDQVNEKLNKEEEREKRKKESADGSYTLNLDKPRGYQLN